MAVPRLGPGEPTLPGGIRGDAGLSGVRDEGLEDSSDGERLVEAEDDASVPELTQRLTRVPGGRDLEQSGLNVVRLVQV